MDALGKTCEQYIQENLETYGNEYYREVYSEDGIKQWIPECRKVRDEINAGKKQILDKY